MGIYDLRVKTREGKGNVEFVLSSEVTKLNADDKLKSIEVTNKKGEVRTIELDGLFVAIGRTPANRIVDELVKMDETGYIVAGENCHTNVDGVFVAGDNRTKEVRQLVTAVSDGAIAAMEAVKYINS